MVLARFVLRGVALAAIFAAVSIAWFVLAGVTDARSSRQEASLGHAVADLWGESMTQEAPTVDLEYTVPREERVTVRGPTGPVEETRVVRVTESESLALTSSAVAVDLRLDQRRKGLLWFSLFDVAFDGDYTYVHEGGRQGTLVVSFRFPTVDGIYDDFVFELNGEERFDAMPQNGVVSVRLPIAPGDTVAFGMAYRSRGRDSFVYQPVQGHAAGQVRNLDVAMTIDFDRYDFPPQTMSPSTSTPNDGGGHTLSWAFRRLVTGQGIGVATPQRVQAGELAASMSLSAPMSLALYMVWVVVLGLLKKVDVHPINHLFLAGAFFSFHLLFAYVADHLPVEVAFALAAGVSLFLTTSYLRLVAGARFACVEAGIAQVLYLVVFSLAHFFDGFTGLTLTLLGVGTLFALMQLTGRIRWSALLAEERTPVQSGG